jgi:holo-[acyl-carrier protein] synthase
MIMGIGIDLVKSSRLQAIVERWGEAFLCRVFTPSEISYCLKRKKSHQPLSARFAVKEAVLKALGMGVRMGIRWKDIETTNDPLGKPVVRLSGQTRKIAKEKQVTDILVTLSHEEEYSIAQVVLLTAFSPTLTLPHKRGRARGE